MAKKRKSRKAPARTSITLSRKQIGIILITIGVLYFFARIFAQESPLVLLAQKIFAVVIGQQGMYVLFAGCIL
ncbi:MAG: hypothetical protein WCJ81_02605 [bacterium]